MTRAELKGRIQYLDRAVSLYNLVLVQGPIADFAASPYPGVQRQIGASAMFLFDDLRRLTRD